MGSKTKKKLEEEKQAIISVKDSLDGYTKALEKNTKVLESINTKKIETIDDEFKKATKSAEDLTEEIKDFNEELNEAGKKGGLKKALQAGNAEKVLKKISILTDKIKKGGDTKQLKKYKAEMEELKGQFGDAKKAEPFQFIANRMKKMYAPMKNMGSNMENIGQSVSAMGGGLRKLPGFLGKSAAAAEGLGGAIGGLSKFAGPVGFGAMIAVEAAKMVLKVDTYIKNLNKKFAAIRGPSLMSGDARKDFKEFNDALFNIGANIKDGLNAGQVYDFMAATMLAGKNVTTLNKGFLTYRDTVHSAAKASKAFGMDISTVGNEMGKMSMEFNMNLKEIDDAFVQVFFDAEKSGYSTDKFWNAVTNATASLSFYGKFIKEASKSLTDFSKNGRISQSSAIKLTDTVENLFARMNESGLSGSLASFVNFVGIDEARDQVKKALGEMNTAIDENTKSWKKAVEERDQATADEAKATADGDKKAAASAAERAKRAQEKMDQLKKEGDALEQNAVLLRAGAKKGSRDFSIADALPVAGGANELIQKWMLKEIKRRGGYDKLRTDQDGTKWKAFIGEVNSWLSGMVSDDDIRAITSSVERTAKNLSQGLALISTNVGSVIEATKDITQDSDQAAVQKAVEAVRLAVEGSTEQAENIVFAMQDAKFKGGFQKLVEQFKKDGNKTALNTGIAALSSGVGLDTKLLSKNLTVSKEATTWDKKRYKDTFKDVRDQTLSMQEMIDIGMDGARYGGAMLSRVDKISKGVGDMVYFLSQRAGGQAPPSQIAAGKAFQEAASRYGQNEAQDPAVVSALKGTNNKQKLIDLNNILAGYKEKSLDENTKLTPSETTDLNNNIAFLSDAIQHLSESNFVTEDQVIDANAAPPVPYVLPASTVPNHVSQPKKDMFGRPMKTGPKVNRANLRSPETVRSAGLVGLDPGETIMPSKSAKLFRENTSSNMNQSAPSQNITISVNATEKDLAQRIANEVRGVLYQNSINGKG